MRYPRNANTPRRRTGGECDNKLEDSNESRSESSGDFKADFAGVKIATLLAYGLHPDTPEGVAAATGAQLLLLLRRTGIRADRLEFSIHAEVERP
jgi:hypothetical protein